MGYIPFQGGDVKLVGKYFADDWKKIILTTDQDLIKDGVQAIDDEFLNWFVQNPTCGWVEVVLGVIKHIPWDKELESKYDYEKGYPITGYKITLPKEEPTMITDWLDKHGDPEIIKKVEKEAELREAAERIYPINFSIDYDKNKEERDIWLEGAKWQQQNSYSEEEVENILIEYVKTNPTKPYRVVSWFKQFKKK